MRLRLLAWHICGLLLTLVLGGMGAATLVRFAPGFGVDEREFDARLSEASVASLKTSRAAENHIARYYVSYLGNILHGNFGVSRSLRRPVSELLAERWRVTLAMAGWGLLGGWALGLGLAVAAVAWRAAAFNVLSAFLCGLLLCLPAAVLGLLILFAGVAHGWAIALVVLPKVFSYARPLLEKIYAAPHVLLARAKGVRPARILLWHVTPAMAPEMLSLAGFSVNLALSAAIPLEAVNDIPGLGQLAWQAALGRDLPVLLTLTLCLALATYLGNSVADLTLAAIGREAAA